MSSITTPTHRWLFESNVLAASGGQDGTWVGSDSYRTDGGSGDIGIENLGVSSNYVHFGTDSSLDIFGANQDFSIVAVCEADTSTKMPIFSAGSASASGPFFGTSVGGKLRFLSKGNTEDEVASVAIPSGRFLVALSADRDGNLVVRQNDTQVVDADISATAAESWNRTADNYKTALDRSGSTVLDGAIFELLLYDFALTSDQMTQLYTNFQSGGDLTATLGFDNLKRGKLSGLIGRPLRGRM